MNTLDNKDFLLWKEKYWNLYYVEIEGEEFLFRELSRSEYKKGLRLYEDDIVSLEDYICQKCVLEPVDFDWENCIAGIPTSLCDMILYESGFSEDTGKLEEYMTRYRSEMTTLDNQIACIIKEAFPDLSLEEIEDWSMEKTIWYYSRAEYILNSLRGINLTIETANAEDEVAQRPGMTKTAPQEKPAQLGDKNFDIQLDGDGSVADFPELAEIQAFMKGKWVPPPTSEDGEELL